MSVFSPVTQSIHLDSRIVAGLERISQAFRTLLWDKAKTYGLSPVQIQIIIFLLHHTQHNSTVSYLAKEFSLTKATISDAVKSLEQKKLIEKIISNSDTRSYSISLSDEGKKIAFETESYADGFLESVSLLPTENKLALWKTISHLIEQLNKLNVISVQRSCSSCSFYSITNGQHFCGLINKNLEVQELKTDCAEHKI